MRIASGLIVVLLFASAGWTQTLLRWDFQQERTVRYQLEQVMRSNAGEMDLEMEAQGEASITLQAEQGEAEVEMALRMVRASVGGEEAPREHLAQQQQTYRTTMMPDGRLETGRYAVPGNIQLLMDLMFPLPERPLDPEEPATQPMVLHATGMPNLEGEAIFTHEGYEEVDGRTLLKYTVTCDLRTPADAELTSGSLTARIECLFDEAEGYFYRVTNELEMEIAAEMPGHPPMRMQQQSHIVVQLQQ